MNTKGGFYISQIKQLQDRIFDKLLNDHGLQISGGQGRILFILWKQDHQTVSDISAATSLAKNTVSIVLDGMVAKGIVKRQINPNNRRQTIISLTDYARTMQKEYEDISNQMGELFYAGFSDKDIKAFEAYLERILSTLQQNEKGDNYGNERGNF